MQNSGNEKDGDLLRRRLSKTALAAVGRYGLIAEGDRILVAISGGKDSHTLLDLLWRARRKSPVRYECLAFHLDQGEPGHDDRALRDWLERLGVEFRIHREDTHTIAREMAGDRTTVCSACSRLRRGVLYTWAARLGCNKIALGHHRDDALQTLLINLFYAGRLQAMPARYTTNDGRFEVIRPLIECAERDIARHARLTGYPIIPCTVCADATGHKRIEAERLLTELEARIPDVRRVMLGALKNVRPTHLLDREVAEAWIAQADRYEPRR